MILEGKKRAKNAFFFFSSEAKKRREDMDDEEGKMFDTWIEEIKQKRFEMSIHLLHRKYFLSKFDLLGQNSTVCLTFDL
jgi:hypothetical protein